MNLHLLLGDTLREFIEHALRDQVDHPGIVLVDPLLKDHMRIDPHDGLVGVVVNSGRVAIHTYIRQTQPVLVP